MKLALGAFLETSFKRKVLAEALYVNETMIFSRSDKLTITEDFSSILEDLMSKAEEKAHG